MHSGGGMRGQSQIERQSGQNNNNNNNNNNSKSSSSYWSILTDPMFSTRASPYKHWIGIPRDVQPAYTIQDILNHQQQQETTKEASIDICCITHDHYDHMDMISVRELKDHVQLWVVPLGIADWLVERCSINRKQIVELEWWQNVRIIRKRTTNTINGRSVVAVAVVVIDDDYENANNYDNDNDNDNEVLTITCCPASHWSGRTIFDRNKRLWCSFAMSLSSTSTSPSNSLSSSSSSFDESKSSLLSNPTTTKTTTTIDTNKKLFNIFFCGDTSYPNNFPLFHQIGDALGPFDLSCIPIGAYLPKEMNKDAHCDPYEALKIHNDIQSKHSIAIHWGSFNLGEEPLYEPPQLLYDAIKKQEQEKKNKKQKQERVDNDNGNVDDGDISAVASRTSIKFDILRHGESRKII
jgi:N-acyl-phosphatidylethanolamine-hydrolysing phospholipase D